MGKSEEKNEILQRVINIHRREKYEPRSENSHCFFEYNISKDTIAFTKNHMFSKLSGKTIMNCMKKLPELGWIHEKDINEFCDNLKFKKKDTLEFRYISSANESIWCLMKIALIKDELENPEILIGSINNINEQKEAFLYQYQSEKYMLDNLTNLYHRESAKRLIEHYLGKEGKKGRHALLIIDIKDFNLINKNLGYVFGDSVLHNIAQAIQETFRKSDIVARIGGDDFLIFMKDINNIEMLQEKVTLIKELFKSTYIGELHNVKISCNIGIARYPNDGNTFEKLFQNADRALCIAEEKEEGNCALCDPFNAEIRNTKIEKYYHSYTIEKRGSYIIGETFHEITEYALRIMSDTKDVESAVKLLLDKIGKFFQCNHIYILEKNQAEKLQSNYWWNKEGELHSKNKLLELGKEIEDYSVYDCFDRDGIFKINNTELFKGNKEISELFQYMNVKSILQCAFYEEGVFKGCVCVGETEKTHLWREEEVRILSIITKIISFYLLKLKVSEKIKEKMEIIENYDGLTKLPTLHKFKYKARAILEKYPNHDYALLYLDFNKFKYINDTLGYEEGDRLLREFAELLTDGTWGTIVAARVSADNFVILMPYVSNDIIKKTIHNLNIRFQSKVKKSNIGSSVYIVCGICVIEKKQDIVDVIDNANAARKYAKGIPKETLHFYDSKMEERIKLELDICNSMEEALENEEFLVYLQPKIDLKENRIVGAEALTRWRRSNSIMMSPNHFIPLFERNGFIINLDFYIYKKVCELLRKWMDEEAPLVPISVNVSRIHMNHKGFVGQIKQLVESYKIPTNLLEFELTESIFLDNTEVALSTMKELRKLGFGVSIDDFGAGFSSLNLLKDMTTDVLKLDKEFLREGDMKKEEKIIVSSIINMAKQLSMKVLSEGVETQIQSEFLKNISCDMAQGYLFAKPMPVEQFELLLRQEEAEFMRKTALYTSGKE